MFFEITANESGNRRYMCDFIPTRSWKELDRDLAPPKETSLIKEEATLRSPAPAPEPPELPSPPKAAQPLPVWRSSTGTNSPAPYVPPPKPHRVLHEDAEGLVVAREPLPLQEELPNPPILRLVPKSHDQVPPEEESPPPAPVTAAPLPEPTPVVEEAEATDAEPETAPRQKKRKKHKRRKPVESPIPNKEWYGRPGRPPPKPRRPHTQKEELPLYLQPQNRKIVAVLREIFRILQGYTDRDITLVIRPKAPKAVKFRLTRD